MDADLCFASATQLRKLIDAKEVSVVERTELFHPGFPRSNQLSWI